MQKFNCKYCGQDHPSTQCTKDLFNRSVLKAREIAHSEPDKWDFCLYCRQYVERNMLDAHWALVHTPVDKFDTPHNSMPQ